MHEITTLTPGQFARFQQLIYRETGIRMQDGKVTLMSNRIRQRLRHHGLESFDDYERLLASRTHPDEMTAFIDCITTNETSFFRTPAHFEWFTGAFLPEFAARVREGTHDPVLRVWSAACSTGEELYTLSICAAEHAHRIVGIRRALLGTDISETVLKKAREGRYAARSFEGVDKRRIDRHFVADADGLHWTVKPTVRQGCEFRHHNLLEPIKGGPFDCVFIRNVMIYFDRASKEIAVGHLVRALAPGGYLVVGPADGIHDLLGGLQKRDTFLYQKPSEPKPSGLPPAEPKA